MKPTVIMIAATFAVALVLGACGGGDIADERDTPTAPPSQTAISVTKNTPGPTRSPRPTSRPRPTALPSAQVTLLNLECYSRAGYGVAEGVIRNTGQSTLNWPTPSSIFRNGSTVVGSGTGWLNVNSLTPGQESGFSTQSLSPVGTFTDCSVQFQAAIGGSCASAEDIARGLCGAGQNISVKDGR